MKYVFLAMTAVSALAVAAPAAAQYQGQYQVPYQGQYQVPYQGQYQAPYQGQYQVPYQGNVYANVNPGMDNRIRMLRTRLQAGVQQGTISQREARPLIQRLNELTRLENRYGRNGFTQRERADLQQRIRSLHQQIRVADRGWYDRYERLDRYGNYQDGYYGRGGPYENYPGGYVDPTPNRGGVGGLIDSILGRNDGLRVGERVSGNLYGVPYEYQGQFRDGNGVYFRSDGRVIYQIDARTNTVMRTYSMNR